MGIPTKNMIVKAISGNKIAANHASIVLLGAASSRLLTSAVMGLDMTATA